MQSICSLVLVTWTWSGTASIAQRPSLAMREAPSAWSETPNRVDQPVALQVASEKFAALYCQALYLQLKLRNLKWAAGLLINVTIILVAVSH